MKRIPAASLLFAALPVSAGNWREDFSQDKPDKKGFPQGRKKVCLKFESRQHTGASGLS